MTEREELKRLILEAQPMDPLMLDRVADRFTRPLAMYTRLPRLTFISQVRAFYDDAGLQKAREDDGYTWSMQYLDRRQP